MIIKKEAYKLVKMYSENQLKRMKFKELKGVCQQMLIDSGRSKQICRENILYEQQKQEPIDSSMKPAQYSKEEEMINLISDSDDEDERISNPDENVQIDSKQNFQNMENKIETEVGKVNDYFPQKMEDIPVHIKINYKDVIVVSLVFALMIVFLHYMKII